MSERTLERQLPGVGSRPLTMEKIAGPVRLLVRLLAARLRRTGSHAESSLSIEERVVIGPKKMVMVVNCGGRRFLLATAGEMIAPLIEIQPFQEKRRRATPGRPQQRNEDGE